MAKRYHIKEEFVEGLRTQYHWDEQVRVLEDQDAMAEMEERSLNDIILIQNDMVLAMKNRIGDSNLAREALQVKGLDVMEIERLGVMLLKSNEMLKLADKLMELKGQATANIRRTPGHIYVLEDPQRVKELQEQYAKMRLQRQGAATQQEEVEEMA